jgi:hypothetical protein
VTRLWVDYNLYGHSRTVRAQVWPEDRDSINIGTRVLVEGDDVETQEAVVTALSDSRREATLQLV